MPGRGDALPGLIEGAAEGSGLGIQFLKHLQRTRLLLHLVDLAPLTPEENPTGQIGMLEAELKKFDPELMDKPRWLVFTKADLLPVEEARERADKIVEELGWSAPWALISAVTRTGTEDLMKRISAELDRLRADAAEAEQSEENHVLPADETDEVP